MKLKRIICLVFILVASISIAACSTAPYTEQSTIRGTIEELITKEKFLFDDKFLLITEPEEDGQNERIYEIPIENFDDYKVGQKVEVVIYSNTNTDDWNLNHLKFEITVIE